MSELLRELKERVIAGGDVSEEEALYLAEEPPLHALFEAASTIRETFRGRSVDLCSVVNAKSGGCGEDCFYCAQSVRYNTNIKRYPLMDRDEILARAEEARLSGARRFCIVTGGRKVSRQELEVIASAIREIRRIGLLPCATLGLLDGEELDLLKGSGLQRYHHNLETSEEYFPRVCTTHTYGEKLRTIQAVRECGLSLCSGGIFGMGESWRDRVRMAFRLKGLGVDSVPINFLMPIEGTPLGHLETLHPIEALRIVSIYRFILPDREIRLCGGRLQTLGEFNSMIFLAGADGLMIGNYLTQKGRSAGDDLAMIRTLGLTPAGGDTVGAGPIFRQ